MAHGNTGNQFWKARSKHGRDKIFATPKALRDAAEEYFEWIEQNPLREEKIFQYQGAIVDGSISKMRAMTITGLCRFLHVDFKTWEDYKKRNDFIHITREIEEIIRDQKFTGAAADLLNANIIARDLGLKDSSEVESTGTINIVLSEKSSKL
tara:strand:+ start:2347 stop:2802 length:456 start_codon:yes stop_codon:yes gene_type:complete